MNEKCNNDILKVRGLTNRDIMTVEAFIKSEGTSILGHLDFDAKQLEDDLDEEESSFYKGIFLDGSLIGLATMGCNDDEESAVDENGEYHEHFILSNVYIKAAEREKRFGSYLVKELIRMSNEEEPYSDIYIDLLDSSLDTWYMNLGFVISRSDACGTYEMICKSAK